MHLPESPAATYEHRKRVLADATDRLSKALVNEGEATPNQVVIIKQSVALLNCGLLALLEISHSLDKITQAKR